MLRRTTRYAVGVGLAAVLAFIALPAISGAKSILGDDGDRRVDLSVIVKFGPGVDPNGG